MTTAAPSFLSQSPETPSSSLIVAEAAELDRALAKASPGEIIAAAIKAVGRDRLAVPTVFTASTPVLRAFEQTMDAYRLKKYGAVLSYICPLMYMNNPLCKKKAVITCSNKLRTYTSARYYTEAEILSIITGGRTDA